MARRLANRLSPFWDASWNHIAPTLARILASPSSAAPPPAMTPQPTPPVAFSVPPSPIRSAASRPISLSSSPVRPPASLLPVVNPAPSKSTRPKPQPKKGKGKAKVVVPDVEMREPSPPPTSVTSRSSVPTRSTFPSSSITLRSSVSQRSSEREPLFLPETPELSAKRALSPPSAQMTSVPKRLKPAAGGVDLKVPAKFIIRAPSPNKHDSVDGFKPMTYETALRFCLLNPLYRVRVYGRH